MRIMHILSKVVETVQPDTHAKEASIKIADDCILVAMEDRAVGLISDDDIVLRKAATGNYSQDTTVGQVMGAEILYCRDTDIAEDVFRIMAEIQVRKLVVLNADKRLVGMVALEDNLRHPS